MSVSADAGSWPPSANRVEAVLASLRPLREATIASIWRTIGDRDRATLFYLLDLAAGLPRFATQETLARMPPGAWPALDTVHGDIVVLQRLVDHPVLPPGAELVDTVRDVESAIERLREHQVVNIDFFLDEDARTALDAAVAEEARRRDGQWGEVGRDESPALHRAFHRGLASDAFRRLTGFEADTHPYSLTLSLQRLERSGIGWHRDLYWPREWVGEDVFAVFHALSDESPDKGGAFVYYLPWHDRVYAFHRRRHQTTILWNAADTDRRILHAVSGYHGDDTRRHLVIAQCMRPGH